MQARDDEVSDDPKKLPPDRDAAKNSPASGGEDESSTERDGNDRHLHDDQKSRPLQTP